MKIVNIYNAIKILLLLVENNYKELKEFCYQLDSKIQEQNSKIQEQNSKIQAQNSEISNLILDVKV